MTTKQYKENGRFIRPPEKYGRLVNFQEFQKKDEQDIEKANNTRRRTKVLFINE